MNAAVKVCSSDPDHVTCEHQWRPLLRKFGGLFQVSLVLVTGKRGTALWSVTALNFLIYPVQDLTVTMRGV